MNSITIILVRDWCVPYHMIFQEETISGPTYMHILHILKSTYWLETGVSLTK